MVGCVSDDGVRKCPLSCALLASNQAIGENNALKVASRVRGPSYRFGRRYQVGRVLPVREDALQRGIRQSATFDVPVEYVLNATGRLCDSAVVYEQICRRRANEERVGVLHCEVVHPLKPGPAAHRCDGRCLAVCGGELVTDREVANVKEGAPGPAVDAVVGGGAQGAGNPGRSDGEVGEVDIIGQERPGHGLGDGLAGGGVEGPDLVTNLDSVDGFVRAFCHEDNGTGGEAVQPARFGSVFCGYPSVTPKAMSSWIAARVRA
jgi:hypothetical protein